MRPLSQEIGSYGWRIRDSEGATPYRAASASYRASVGRFETGVEQLGRSVRGTAEFEGAIATMGGGVFFSNRIDDSFAVVDVGAPGVEVFYENRPLGMTNSQGMFMVPSLRAYQANKISIDPRNLPVNAEIPQVKDIVAPADRSGVVVRFGVKTNVSSAVVMLTDAEGKPLPVGLKGRINGREESFVVGYDGRTFVKNLIPENSILRRDRDGRMSCQFRVCSSGGRPSRDRTRSLPVTLAAPLKRRLVGVLAFAWTIAAADVAGAQTCSFSITNVNFGNINVTANTVFDTTATFSANCTGNGNRRICICPSIGLGTGGSTTGNPRFLLSGANQLNLQSILG